MGRRDRLLAAALSVAAGVVAAPVALRVALSWRHRVAVAGHSMEPSLRDGDWLLVDPDAFHARAPRAGELVVARDPRDPARVIVKRVAAVQAGQGGGRVLLAGDHPAHLADSETIGAVETGAIIGRPWFRYRPLARAGSVR